MMISRLLRSRMFRALGRYRRLGATCFLSCLCFMALAVYGWGVTWKDVGFYTAATVVLLAALMLSALLAGWLLRQLMRLLNR